MGIRIMNEVSVYVLAVAAMVLHWFGDDTETVVYFLLFAILFRLATIRDAVKGEGVKQ